MRTISLQEFPLMSKIASGPTMRCREVALNIFERFPIRFPRHLHPDLQRGPPSLVSIRPLPLAVTPRASAASAKRNIELFGANTKRLMAGAPAAGAVQISTAQLHRIVQYEPRDLTI